MVWFQREEYHDSFKNKGMVLTGTRVWLHQDKEHGSYRKESMVLSGIKNMIPF